MSNANPMKVSKDQTLVHIFMSDQARITGNVHINKGSRLSDLMNQHGSDIRPFLSITDAIIIFPNGNKFSVPFITVNKNNICTCFPAADK